ncbi:hypothetical protein [Schlesneria sp. T3-172]|uniref:hypothetical protein n=1 Tax=Schlesneria sphaerica TaxID=3373610 RepID=UPI0037C5D512
MEFKVNKSESDRWWIVALCVSIVGIILVVLLWCFPTSKLVWLIAGGALLFVAVLHFNPRYRYWRRANICFGVAGALAFVPSFEAKANFVEIGAFEFVAETSSVVVLGFLIAGLFLAWIDAGQQGLFMTRSGITAKNENLSFINSPYAISGLTAGGNIIINQGVLDEKLLAVIDARLMAPQIHEGVGNGPRQVDEDLVWRLVDSIKDARRRFEQEDVVKLIAELTQSFENSGKSWSKSLRTETLLLFAEYERGKISELRASGGEADLSKLQQLLKELQDG